MDLSGEFVFDVPRHLVWNMLQDPVVLEAVLPGGRNFVEVADSEYTGELVIKVGPVQGTFQGRISLSNFNAPESYWIEVNGKGATGVVKASGRLHLADRGNQTLMTYSGQVDIGGRIASVGQRLLENAAYSIIRQSLEALNKHMKSTIEQPSTESSTILPPSQPASTVPQTKPSTPPVTMNPPKQAEVAPSVSSNGLTSLIPAEYIPWLIGATVVIVVFILLLVASR